MHTMVGPASCNTCDSKKSKMLLQSLQMQSKWCTAFCQCISCESCSGVELETSEVQDADDVNIWIMSYLVMMEFSTSTWCLTIISCGHYQQSFSNYLCTSYQLLVWILTFNHRYKNLEKTSKTISKTFGLPPIDTKVRDKSELLVAYTKYTCIWVNVYLSDEKVKL